MVLTQRGCFLCPGEGVRGCGGAANTSWALPEFRPGCGREPSCPSLRPPQRPRSPRALTGGPLCPGSSPSSRRCSHPQHRSPRCPSTQSAGVRSRLLPDPLPLALSLGTGLALAHSRCQRRAERTGWPRPVKSSSTPTFLTSKAGLWFHCLVSGKEAEARGVTPGPHSTWQVRGLSQVCPSPGQGFPELPDDEHALGWWVQTLIPWLPLTGIQGPGWDQERTAFLVVDHS